MGANICHCSCNENGKKSETDIFVMMLCIYICIYII